MRQQATAWYYRATNTQSIVLGGGCFWCIEAVYQRIKGVEHVRAGYSGGTQEDPTYHNHGDHAEVVEITFNDSVINLQTILSIFWTVHDPTTLNRQGSDVGASYRSIILYKDQEQRAIAEDSKKQASGAWDDPIVTQIEPLDTFYEAEDYHQDYFNQNQANPYCQVVINPKLSKLQSSFKELLK